jgi:hypothetical protein
MRADPFGPTVTSGRTLAHDRDPLFIISGGQTGVDRAALDAALSLQVPCGGRCPKGRIAEDGIIAERYPLVELELGGYKRRTLQNVLDSRGTLILYFSELEGGSEQTFYRCVQHHKPYKLIDGDEVAPARAAELALAFVRERRIRRLNVAGPRASKCPRAYPYAFQAIMGLLKLANSAAD